MAKPLKIVLIVIGVILTLFIGVAIAVPMFFDPNDYRGQIQTAAQDSTGRELTLGDIKLSVFPWLAIKVSDVKIANAAGFGPEPFATLAEAKASVRLMPLFSKRIEIGTVTVKGLHLNLAKDKDGKDNWSDMSKPDEEKKPEEPENPDAAFDPKNLNVGGIEIEDANFNYADAQSGKKYQVEKLNLKTGELEVGKPVDMSLALAVISAAPQMRADITLDSKLDADMDNQMYKLDELKLGVKADGDGMKADIALDGGKSALDLKSKKVDISGMKLDLKSELKDMKADMSLVGTLAGNLDTQVFDVSGLKLDGKASGKSIPGGEQPFALTGGLKLDLKQGTLAIANAVLAAAGLSITTNIAGENIMGDDLKLHGPITVKQFSPRDVMTKLGMKAPETADPNVLKAMSFNADFAGGKKSAVLSNMKLVMDQTNATGNVNIKDFATMAIDFAFKVDQLDADRYMAPKKPGESVKDAPTDKSGKKSDIAKIELPGETLNNLNAQGTLDVGMLKASGVKLTNAQVKLSGGKGQIKKQTVSAKLYGGSIGFDHQFTPGAKPQYLLKTNLNALNAAPFLTDFLGKDYVSGLANFNLTAGGNGLKMGDLLATLNGDTGFKVENGAVKGFNLASIIRKGKAMLAGNMAYKETEAKQTDFSAFSGSAKIVNGVIKADTLSAAAPLFRLSGAGDIDLVHQTIDYLAKPTIVETSSGEGGKDMADLKGITIPVKVTGSLFAPSYKLDLQEALKQKALSKVNEKIDENKAKLQQKFNDKLGEGLNKLFAPRNKPAPAPAPAPATPPQQ